jgi:hypothetical protein
MSLISVVVVLVVVGVILWLINNYIPMDAKIKTVLNVVVLIVVCIWLLQAFGLMGNVHGINTGVNTGINTGVNIK